ncbi:MAG: hypothetical protein ACMXYC_02515 [Candidatus Woesearchaeota archaeon]
MRKIRIKQQDMRLFFSSMFIDYMIGVVFLSLLNASILGVGIGAIFAFISFEQLLPAIGSISPHYWVPATVIVIFFIGNLVFYAQRYSLYYVEEKIPEFKDMLTTIYDYQESENPVIQQLHKDAIHKAHHLSTSPLIDIKKLGKRFVYLLGCIGLFLVIPATIPVLATIPTIIDYDATNWFTSQLGEESILQDGQHLLGDAAHIATEGNRIGVVLDTGMARGDMTNMMAWQAFESSHRNVNVLGQDAVVEVSNIEPLPDEQDLIKAYTLQVRSLG